jgi:hypothetical protein
LTAPCSPNAIQAELIIPVIATSHFNQSFGHKRRPNFFSPDKNGTTQLAIVRGRAICLRGDRNRRFFATLPSDPLLNNMARSNTKNLLITNSLFRRKSRRRRSDKISNVIAKFSVIKSQYVPVKVQLKLLIYIIAAVTAIMMRQIIEIQSHR